MLNTANNTPATTKQINFIKSLVESLPHDPDVNPDVAEFTSRQASILITKLLKAKKTNQKITLDLVNSVKKPAGDHSKITKEDVKNPFENLTSLKVITAEDVKNDYFNSIGLYDYKALQQAKAKNNDKDIKYYQKALNNYIVVETSDNLKFLLNTENSSGIVTTLWFSDEGDVPTLTRELFIKENYIHHNFIRRYDESTNRLSYHRTLYIVKGSYSYYTCDYSSIYYKDSDIIRPLTSDEMEDFKIIVRYVKDLFTERLVKYWNRYSDKVRIDTYWADR